MSDGTKAVDPPPPQAGYYDRPGVAVVTWDPSCRAAHIVWQGWANTEEFAAANDAIIRALTENRASRALGDLRKMKVIQQPSQDWAQNDWLPRVIAAGLRRMALVIPESGLTLMNVESILSRVPGTKLDVAYFATIDEARAWLTQPVTATPVSLEAKSFD